MKSHTILSPPDTTRFQAVLFDLFGTLVQDFVFSLGSANTDLATVLDVPREPFAQLWRRTSEMRIDGTFQSVEASILHVCNAIGERVRAERVARAVEIRLDQIRQALKPKPDAVPMLKQLKEEGYKIGLLSNCSIEIPLLWPETPFAEFMDATVFSSRESLKKPDPHIYDVACARLGAAPPDCVYVADGENFELAAAASAGLHPVLIRNTAADSRGERLREAREWRGASIYALAEVSDFLKNRASGPD